MQINCAAALVGFSSVEKCASETLLDKSVRFLRCILSSLAKSCRALVPLQCSSPAAGSIFWEAGWWGIMHQESCLSGTRSEIPVHRDLGPV